MQVYDRKFIFFPLPFECYRVLLVPVNATTSHVFRFAVTLHFPVFSSAFSVCFCNPWGVSNIATEGGAGGVDQPLSCLPHRAVKQYSHYGSNYSVPWYVFVETALWEKNTDLTSIPGTIFSVVAVFAVRSGGNPENGGKSW